MTELYQRCPVCLRPGGGTSVSAAQMRSAASAGFHRYISGIDVAAGGVPPRGDAMRDLYMDLWRTMVDDRSADWDLCDRCAPVLLQYLDEPPAPAGIVAATVTYLDLAGPDAQRMTGSAHWSRSEIVFDYQGEPHAIGPALWLALDRLSLLDAFAQLPHDGVMTTHEMVTLRQAGLARAAAHVRDAAAAIGAGYDWETSYSLNDGASHRVRVDGAGLRQDLLAFAGFLEAGGHAGCDVVLEI